MAGVRAASALALVAALAACKGRLGTAASGSTEAPADAEPAGAYERIEAGPSAVADGGAPAPPMILALESPTPIQSRPEWPPKDPSKAADERREVIRLGSLRKGQSAAVKPEVLKKPNCPEGWYELLAGGFVCGKQATLDPSHKELASAPHAPFADGPLPYHYGLNLTNGTPLYRRAPLRRERAEVERGLPVGKGAKPGDGAAGEDKWYLKSHNGQRPLVTFDDMKGERGLVELRMVRGFYLGLDKEVRAFAGRFWRTTSGKFVPADHILVHKPKTEFEGVWVGREGEPRKLPLAWVVSIRARRYTLDETGKVRRSAELVPRFSILQLTGKRQVIEGRAYYETSEGWWMRDLDGTVTRPSPPPGDLSPGERWIDINLTTQSLVAFEGDKPVFATIVSTGRHDDTDKEKDHRTPAGSYRVREKHISATMDDDSASDGPYSIQDVPWIMYFHKGYALHGAFWHSSFGRERSHGCVNLTPHDARELFQWTGPKLPDGWHSVRATEKNEGTRVVVHE